MQNLYRGGVRVLKIVFINVLLFFCNVRVCLQAAANFIQEHDVALAYDK